MWGELKNKALMKKRNLDAQIEAEKAIQAAATTELKTTSAQTFQLVDNYLKAGLKDKAKTLLQEIVDVYPNESEPYKRAKQMLSSL